MRELNKNEQEAVNGAGSIVTAAEMFGACIGFLVDKNMNSGTKNAAIGRDLGRNLGTYVESFVESALSTLKTWFKI